MTSVDSGRSTMRELVELMERWSPGIATTLAPTPEADIEKIAVAAGPLPGTYLRFLRTMGASTGDFKIDLGNADLRSDRIWNLHERVHRLLGSRYLYIGQDNSPDGCDYFLDQQAMHGEDDCWVVRMPLQYDFDPRRANAIHAGLGEMLYYEAFLGLRLPNFPYHRRFKQIRQGDDAAHWPKAETICDLAKTLGFTRIPPATRSALYERGDAALLLYQRLVRPVFAFILATDKGVEFEHLSDAFVKAGTVTIDPNPVF